MPVRIGSTLAMAAATGRRSGFTAQVLDQLAVAAQDDLVGQSTGTCRCHSRTLADDRLCGQGP